jgi:hypothetical protein
LLNANKQEFLR